MVWSVLLRVLAKKHLLTGWNSVTDQIRSFYSMVFEANTRNKTKHTMWNGMENYCARKCFISCVPFCLMSLRRFARCSLRDWLTIVLIIFPFFLCRFRSVHSDPFPRQGDAISGLQVQTSGLETRESLGEERFHRLRRLDALPAERAEEPGPGGRVRRPPAPTSREVPTTCQRPIELRFC